MFKFIQNKQVNHNNDLPAFIFKGQKLLPPVCGLLKARGITDENLMRVYFEPDESDLQDALKLKNINAASARIKQAVENNEHILIFGDYDADGICATAILYTYLKNISANVTAYIPDRQDGYGLSEDTIERLAEEYEPDLWLTCDCGISNAKEAEYILDLGMDIIVTDHHELPDLLPDCITVSPKLPDQDYGYLSLCGAGVALMLVWACGGLSAARPFFNLAAIATIGDMVPLDGENRIITQLGLKQINGNPPAWLKKLAVSSALNFPLSAQDLAYKIVPKINAAGRMARAADAFDFITAETGEEREEYFQKIEEAAGQRKTASDALIQEALADLKAEKLYDEYAIILSSPDWEKGIMGIAAAQLCGTYNRPVFLMAKAAGKTYKGTARSIQGINIREVLNAAADTLIEFGGHSQAAGFSVLEKNIPLFKEKVLSYLKESADKELFGFMQEYDAEILPGDITLELARQLKLFEPFGTDNRQPLFRLKTEKATVTAMKNKPEHITVCPDKTLSILGFNCHKLTDILKSSSAKELLIEIRTSTYMGREDLSVILKHSSCPVFNDDIDGGKIAARYICCPHGNIEPKLNNSEKTDAGVKYYKYADLSALVKERMKGQYGLIIAAYSYASYKKFADEFDPCGENYLHEYLHITTRNNYNRLIIAPDFSEIDLEFYHTVIFLDALLDDSFAPALCGRGAEIFAPSDNAGIKEIVKDIDLSRERFSMYYRLFMDMQGAKGNADNLYNFASARSSDIKMPQFVVCLYVFQELQLLEYGIDTPLKLLKGKAELSNSKLYKRIAKIQE